ncbi:MAG: chemotaxis protein CheD [Nitrospirae bacterium]|nr:chemotaxis protein CheD [Nitrospirota bacterium]
MTTQPAGLPLVLLNPGEMHFAETPSVVRAVVGTSISVMLFSRRMSMGAICHGLLPACYFRQLCKGGCSEQATYVECAIENMIGQFKGRGASAHELEVRIIGAAELFDAKKPERLWVNVGFRNFVAARWTLQKNGIRRASTDIGGIHARQVAFYPHSGEVIMHRLNKNTAERGCQWRKEDCCTARQADGKLGE